MVTQLAQVSIAHAENAFTVTCSCGWTAKRRMRIDADLIATGHLRTHGRPHPADHQEDDRG